MAGVFVYVISGDHGRQKIGVSDNPPQRIKDLQTGSPFRLRFEFVGITEGTGYDIEGEAHFLLHQHRAPGGDEWFVVPPEVAITAVMAAARKLDHKLRPVDPDNLPSPRAPVSANPAWMKWAKILVGVASLWPLAMLIMSFDSGRIGTVSFVIGAALLVGGIKLAIFALGEFAKLAGAIGNALRPEA